MHGLQLTRNFICGILKGKTKKKIEKRKKNDKMKNYKHRGGILSYENLEKVILCSAISKPKPGVFDPIIKYILILSTVSEVIILGLQENNRALSIVPVSVILRQKR